MLVGSTDDGRAFLVFNLDQSLADKGLDAVALVRDAAKHIGGGGGGRPTLAEAGGKKPEALGEALEAAEARLSWRSFEGAGARLRLGPHRRRRLRPDRHRRPAALRGRAAPTPGSIRALVEAEAAERVVVGLPLTLRGERGEQAEETERFVEELRAAVDVPVETFDERFTTARRAGRGRRRPRRRAPPVQLPRVVEPPELSRPTPASRWSGGALVALVLVAAVAGGRRVVGRRRRSATTGSSAPPTTTVAPPKILGCSSRRGSPCTRWRSAPTRPARDHGGGLPARDGFLAAPGKFAGDGKRRNLEGFLFPATYYVYETDPAGDARREAARELSRRTGGRSTWATRARRT